MGYHLNPTRTEFPAASPSQTRRPPRANKRKSTKPPPITTKPLLPSKSSSSKRRQNTTRRNPNKRRSPRSNQRLRLNNRWFNDPNNPYVPSPRPKPVLLPPRSSKQCNIRQIPQCRRTIQTIPIQPKLRQRIHPRHDALRTRFIRLPQKNTSKNKRLPYIYINIIII